MIVWALWAQYRWYLKPSWGWSVAAGLITGLAIYVKGTGLFFVLPAFAGMVLFGMGLKQALRSLKFWLVAILAVLPYALYTYYGMYVLHLLEDQLALRFFPSMLIDPVFYLHWMGPIKSAVGYGAFMLALLGLLLFSNKTKRGFMIGAWFGYLVYGMVFPYHITTHDYYQMPLIPLVALGLAGAAQPLFARLVDFSLKKTFLWVGAASLILVFALTITGWDSIVTLKRDDYRNEVTFWVKMGKMLENQGPVVGLTHDYGYRLGYWGWEPIANWMTSADFNLQALAGNTYDMKAYFKQATAGKNLFVVTLLQDFNSQPALKEMLNDHYQIFAQAGDYIIYDLRKPK
jgi:4-amino-4-deoxy-L-arabinose transferase-like glycosyltransferase